MASGQQQDETRKAVKRFSECVEKKNVDAILSCFSDSCEIEFLNVKLKGKHGAREWIKWLYGHMSELKYEPVLSMADENGFLMEYVLEGTLHNGIKIKSRQAQIFVFDGDYKIENFRYYFDRLDFVESAINRIMAKSLKMAFNQKTLNHLTKYAVK
jgi:hypothetical protein